MRRWRIPLLIFVALFSTSVWALIPPTLAHEGGSPVMPNSEWLPISYFGSFGCGIISGAAVATAFAIRSKRIPNRSTTP